LEKIGLCIAKLHSALGGNRHLIPWPGALPVDPTGAEPPDPYRLMLPCSTYPKNHDLAPNFSRGAVYEF